MRVRTRSACVVLAWGILLLLLLTAGSTGSPRHTQANNRTAATTSNTTQTTHTTLTQATLTQATLTDSLASRTDAATTSPAAHPAPQRYVVQPGDTLTGIAAALGTSGGWPALYAANQQAIGPDPDLIGAGTTLVLPAQTAPTRYTITAGDTLTGIAAALGTSGGWTALYAANRQAIGPDPNLIKAGTALTIPHPTPPAPAPPAPRPAPAPAQPPAATQPPAPANAPTTAPAPAQPPASAKVPTTAPAQAPAQPAATQPAATQPRASARPRTAAKTPATAGLPRWLEIVLLAAGVLIATAFLTELLLAIGRRRRRTARPAVYPAGPSVPGPAACAAAPDPRILLADYDRLVVTSSGPDGTVCVLRPPGADPDVILLAARLVLPQDRYEELAGHLGVTAQGWRE
jgi:LysM repeat protein